MITDDKIGKGWIQRIEIELNCGEKFEVDPSYVLDLAIFESIEQPGVTGYMEMLDFQQIATYDGQPCGGLAPGDKIKISFISGDSSGFSGIKTFKGIIYAVEDYRLEEAHHYNRVKIRFCSKWFLKATCGTLKPQVFKNKKAHQIVAAVLGQCGCPIRFIDSTVMTYEKIITPLWPPLAFAFYLLRSERSQGYHSCGWLIFENTGAGVVICTRKQVFKHNHTLFPQIDDVIEAFHPNPAYKGAAKVFHFKELFDATYPLYNGTFNCETQQLYYDTDELWIFRNISPSEVEDHHNSDYYPFPRKYINWPKTVLDYSKYIQKSDKLTFNEFGYQNKTRIENNIFRNYTDCIKLVVVAQMNTKRMAGQYIRVNVLRQKKGERKYDKRLSGRYIIRDLVHKFENGKPFQIMTLMQDGYFMGRPDQIPWHGGEG